MDDNAFIKLLYIFNIAYYKGSEGDIAVEAMKTVFDVYLHVVKICIYQLWFKKFKGDDCDILIIFAPEDGLL